MGLCRLFILRPVSSRRDHLPSQGCVWAGPAHRSPGRLAELCTWGHVYQPLQITELRGLGWSWPSLCHVWTGPYGASHTPTAAGYCWWLARHQKQHDILSCSQFFSRDTGHWQCRESGQAINTQQKDVERTQGLCRPSWTILHWNYIYLSYLLIEAIFFSFLLT